MIGLKRGTVKLFSHHRSWEKYFEKEKGLLKKTFGKTIIALEHIGSTAIPSIHAKPIIDINIGVRSLEVAKRMKAKFKKIGYKHRPFAPGKTKQDLRWQELYVKGPEKRRTHHVHVTVFGNEYWQNDLLFREYLRKHPEYAKQYDILKMTLARKFAGDRTSYTKNKQQFILRIINKARRRSSLVPPPVR